MRLLRFAARLLPFAVMVFGAAMVCGQSYPNRPVRIVTTEPGSGTDLMARIIAQELTAGLGQPVIVDNRGIIAMELVAKAAPDGYTLLLYTSPLWLTPIFRDRVPWDPVKDFSTITAATATPNVLVVHPSLPVVSVKELIALGKTRPGELNYGSGSTGASAHIAAELFKAMAGVDIVRVAFKGTGAALNSLIGGQIQLMFHAAGSATPHVKSGKLKALAVTSTAPSALAPGLPTMAAAGVPGYESISIAGVFAPAKTPAALINRLNQEIVRALNKAEVKERLFSSGLDVVGSSPQEFASLIGSEMARMRAMVKNIGFTN